MKSIDGPVEDRCLFIMTYAYSKLPELDDFGTSLANKILAGGRGKFKTQFDGVCPTVAEYLADSWFQVMFPSMGRISDQLRIPEEDLSRIRSLLAEHRPLGAM